MSPNKQREVLSIPRFKGGRVTVFSPDAVKLRQNTMVENIEEGFQYLVAIAPLRNVIYVCRWQR